MAGFGVDSSRVTGAIKTVKNEPLVWRRGSPLFDRPLFRLASWTVGCRREGWVVVIDFLMFVIGSCFWLMDESREVKVYLRAFVVCDTSSYYCLALQW